MLYREGTGYGAHSLGTGWTSIMGKMRMLSVGISVSEFANFLSFTTNFQAVWAVNPADEVFVRVGLSEDEPKGKEWTKIDGSMKMVR